MVLNRYAEIDALGVCFALLDSTGTTEAEHMVPIAPGEDPRGQRWTGQGWEAKAPTEKDKAASDLQTIDRETGMTRTLRETLIAIAGKVGADVTFLATKEAAAVAARAKLK